MKLKFKFKNNDKKAEKQNEKNAEKKALEIKQVTENYHKMSLEEIESKFASSLTNGLDEKQAAKLLIENGPNKIKQKKPNQFIKYFKYFFSGFGALFMGAAILCILAWQPIGSLNGQTPQILNLALGVMLILVVIIQGFFNAFQDWSSKRVMNSIKNMMPSYAYVIRNGKEVVILKISRLIIIKQIECNFSLINFRYRFRPKRLWLEIS
jgi:sodium/potassium-transporting ATPase subunit alpha